MPSPAGFPTRERPPRKDRKRVWNLRARGSGEGHGAGGGRAAAPAAVSPPSPPGRYNNQWMVVDYKAFVPGGPSPGSRVLTVLEQIP